MPIDERYCKIRWSARAVIAGVEVDVVRVQADFALNTISQCQVSLPLGRVAATGGVAQVAALVAGITTQQPIQVYVRASAIDRSDPGVRTLGLPEGEFLLFDGLTAGGAASRSRTAATYDVTANGWGVELNQASALSDSSHPGNPARFSYGMILQRATDTGAKADGTVITQFDRFVNQTTLAGDVWGDAIFPWMKYLTEQDGIWIVERNLRGDGTNGQAARALARLAPGNTRYYVPCRLRQTPDADLANEIAGDMATTASDPSFAANQTLWDILVGALTADYGLAVVSRPRDGIVIPYCPAFRGGPRGVWETIRADEYVTSEVYMATPRPLRAFGVFSGIATLSGSTFDDGQPASQTTGLGGWFSTADGRGAVILAEAPRWLSGIVDPSRWAADSAGLGGVVGAASAPGAGKATGAVAAGKRRGEALIKPLLDSYAQMMYARTVLKDRYATVSGALRFDIAPGSVVALEGATEIHSGVADSLGRTYVGEVLRVSILLDAEAPAAGTAFHLGSVRTAAENGSDRTSVAGPPFYAAGFRGCPLVG